MSETATVIIDPSNAAAAEAWDGDDGAHWVQWDEIYDRSVARYDDALLAAAGVRAADRVLDIGCGSGGTTRAVAQRAPDGGAFGLDLCSGLVDLARRKATEQGVGNVWFIRGDAQAYPFEPASYDVAISRTGSMFFGDPIAAFTNVRRALRRAGRLALLTWQPVPDNPWFLDIWTAVSAGRDASLPPAFGPGPFSLSDPARVRSVLGSAGFVDVTIADHREPMYFGRDADQAIAFMTTLGVVRSMLTGVDDATRRSAHDALRRSVHEHAAPDGVLYPSAAWVITAEIDEKHTR